jgi:hypothetical protein
MVHKAGVVTKADGQINSLLAILKLHSDRASPGLYPLDTNISLGKVRKHSDKQQRMY